MPLVQTPFEKEVVAPKQEATFTPRTFRWTLGEYRQLEKTNLFRNRRVELIEGEIVEMSPIGFLHIKGVAKSTKAVEKAFGDGFFALSQSSMVLDDDSEPQPDVAVFVGNLDDLADVPANPVLIIEVSDTTLSYDRTTKARIYARAGVADYWILNVQADVLEVYRNPVNGKYDPKVVYRKGHSVAPLAAPNALVLVDDLLP